jgi:hypothetical protein
MTEKPEASVLTARRAAQHFRLSSADDACEHLYILIVRSSLGPSPPNAGRYTVASRFRCRSCERGYIFPRAPEQFVASPLCLVGYVRWDARSDRVPPLQTIIFSSFTGRTKGCRLYAQDVTPSSLDLVRGKRIAQSLIQRIGSSMRSVGYEPPDGFCHCTDRSGPMRNSSFRHCHPARQL